MLKSLLPKGIMHGNLSGAQIQAAWRQKKENCEMLREALMTDSLHVRKIRGGSSVFNSQFEVRFEDSAGRLVNWDSGQEENDSDDEMETCGMRPSTSGDSLHSYRKLRFKGDFQVWESTEEGRKPVPEPKRSTGQVVDLLVSDPPDFKEKLLQRDVKFLQQLEDINSEAEEVKTKSRLVWTEADEARLEDFRNWVQKKGKAGHLHVAKDNMTPASTASSYCLQVRELQAHLTKDGRDFHLNDSLDPSSGSPTFVLSEDLESFISAAEGQGYNPAATQLIKLCGIRSWLRYTEILIRKFESDTVTAETVKKKMIANLEDLGKDVWWKGRVRGLSNASAKNATVIKNLEEKVSHRSSSRVD